MSFADGVDDEVDVADDSGTAYPATQTLIDDTGHLTVDVPTEWADVMTSPLDDGRRQ